MADSAHAVLSMMATDRNQSAILLYDFAVDDLKQLRWAPNNDWVAINYGTRADVLSVNSNRVVYTSMRTVDSIADVTFTDDGKFLVMLDSAAGLRWIPTYSFL